MNKDKSKLPSRVRYEQAHPTVSCRVPREIYDRLQAVIKAEGRSFADILKIGLGIVEVKMKGEEEIRKKAHTMGYQIGYKVAEDLYKITFSCPYCGDSIEITTKELKQAVIDFAQERGWVHTRCYEKQ